MLPDLEDDVLESYEEHHVADLLCMELSGMPPDAERFGAKTTVLIEIVLHHIEEEEQEWFPKARPSLAVSGFRKSVPGSSRPGNMRRTPAQPGALKKTIDAVIS